MRVLRSNRHAILGLAAAFVLVGATTYAQEPLSRAKTYYASAAYEDALLALDDARVATRPVEATEVAAYRVFCLIALGRTDDARLATEALVLMNPLYRPSEDAVSPRVRTFIEDVRRPMLADVIRQTYATARAAFNKNDLPTAAAGFDLVLTLLNETEDAAEADDLEAADLRMLVSGFKDLTDASLVRAKAEAEATAAARVEAEAAAEAEAEAEASALAEAEATALAAAEAEATAEGERNRVYSEDEAGLVKPVVLSRALPEWTPPNPTDARKLFSGVLELVIDQDGTVESVVLRKSVHPAYDELLRTAARDWRFAPATVDGAPVKYRYRLGVQIGQ